MFVIAHCLHCSELPSRFCKCTETHKLIGLAGFHPGLGEATINAQSGLVGMLSMPLEKG